MVSLPALFQSGYAKACLHPNLSFGEVEAFRSRVMVVDRRGLSDPAGILAALDEAAAAVGPVGGEAPRDPTQPSQAFGGAAAPRAAAAVPWLEAPAQADTALTPPATS